MINTNPVALITGASRGIGAGIALSLAEQGYHLALMARSEQALFSISQQCEAKGVQVLPLVVDVNDKVLVKESISQLIQQFGRLDTFVCNQGTFEKKINIDNDVDDSWETVLMTNLHASMHLTRLVLPHIIDSPPSLSRAIIFMASVAGKLTSAGNAAYCASKHGLLGFANSVFEEVREYPIKISSICPGFVDTDMVNKNPRLNPKKMIQVTDIVTTVNYILAMSANCCPQEILLKPQMTPYV